MFKLSRNTYLWPPGAVLALYHADGTVIDDKIRQRKLDLFDTLILPLDLKKRTVLLGLRCPKHAASWWSEELLQFVEGRIRYDFTFEGYAAKVTRLTKRRVGDQNLSCGEQFRWRLDIQEKWGD